NETGVHHRGRNRICAQGQTAYGVVVEVGRDREHHPARQGGTSAAEQHPPQVDVPGRVLSRGQHEVPADHGLVVDHFQEIVAVAHAWQRNPGEPPHWNPQVIALGAPGTRGVGPGERPPEPRCWPGGRSPEPAVLARGGDPRNRRCWPGGATPGTGGVSRGSDPPEPPVTSWPRDSVARP